MQFSDLITLIFENIKDFIHLFYNRISNISGPSIDFSFLMATLLLLIIAWIINFILKSLKTIEKKYDYLHEVLRRKHEERFNAALQREYLIQEYKNNKFLFSIKFEVEDKYQNYLNQEETLLLRKKERDILLDFFEIIDKEIECKKEIMNNDVAFLYFDDFNLVNSSIYSINLIVKEMQQKYSSGSNLVSFFISMDTYAKTKELELKFKQQFGLIKLGLKNKIICLSTFKERYSLVKNKNYLLAEEGIYQVLDEYREVFCIKSLK